MSYHDVVVYVDGVKYVPADNYNLCLQCTKIGGWELWRTASEIRDWKLIGGEYDKGPFCIEVAGHVILGEKPEFIKEPEPFGWSGFVVRTGNKIEFK